MTLAEQNRMLALEHRMAAVEDRATEIEKRLIALEAKRDMRALDEMNGLKYGNAVDD